MPLPILFCVLRCELRRLSRDAACGFTLALLAGLTFYAVGSGQRLVEERAHTATAWQADAQQRLAVLETQLEKIERGAEAPPDKPWRDPRNPLSVGNLAAATAAPSTAPLAALAVGIADLYPSAFKVGIGTPDTFLFADEMVNPLHAATGRFDLAFVLTAVLPLCIIALCFNVVSAEREQGTLALTLASPVSAPWIFLGKLAVRAFLPVALAVFLSLFLALSATGAANPPPLADLFWLTAAILLYSAFWTALTAWVSSLGKDSAFNALALFAAWAVLLLVVPALINAAAQGRHPLPARAELVLAARTAAIEVERESEAADFRESHGLADPSRIQAERRLRTQKAAQARVEAILDRQDAATARQQHFATQWAIFSPPMLFQEILADLAGTGPQAMTAKVSEVRAFHRVWQSFFLARAEAGKPLTRADYATFPAYRPTPTAASGPRAHPLPWILLLLALLPVFSLLATNRLARFCSQ